MTLGIMLLMGLADHAQAADAPWVPTHYRCTYDQLNNERGLGRLRWADRNRSANLYGVASSNGRDFNFLANDLARQALHPANTVVVYPVYVDPDKAYAVWRGPGGVGTPSETLPAADLETLPHTSKPVGVFNDGLCEAGCYTPNQKVLFDDGPLEIAAAQRVGRSQLMTLSAEASFANFELIQNQVLHYTMDKQPGLQQILTFQMQSGGRLSVTLEHPLLTSDGMMHKARQLSVGEHLLRQDGTPDEIVRIDDDVWYGRVYNLKPVTTDLTSNIVVAQGYLNGSGRYQTEFVAELNRVLLRSNVPDALVPGR